MQQRDCKIDVIVNVRFLSMRVSLSDTACQIDTGSIDFLDPHIASMVNLTAADRKWMDDVRRLIMM